ncbi:hypothetical protein GCM10023215_16900 [Pseudonocardia yuanmonensis]|uniref:Uncharacterized protein n=1 Tax=Pseudonocardia yuanmonensis TaxID=1095914 RepID=A0ABP8W881_9PSEU
MSSDEPEEGTVPAPSGFATDDDMLALLGHDGAALPTEHPFESW